MPAGYTTNLGWFLDQPNIKCRDNTTVTGLPRVSINIFKGPSYVKGEIGGTPSQNLWNANGRHVYPSVTNPVDYDLVIKMPVNDYLQQTYVNEDFYYFMVNYDLMDLNTTPQTISEVDIGVSQNVERMYDNNSSTVWDSNGMDISGVANNQLVSYIKPIVYGGGQGHIHGWSKLLTEHYNSASNTFNVVTPWSEEPIIITDIIINLNMTIYAYIGTVGGTASTWFTSGQNANFIEDMSVSVPRQDFIDGNY